MNSDSLNVTHTLSIDCVELYTTANSTLKLATKGPLNLLYIQAYNCYILQINDFRYCLYETIPILVSLQETHCIRSYVIPNINGNYIIKVTTTSNLKVLDDLESIFQKNSRLAYKTRSGENSTATTDLEEIQCNVDEDSSPKSAFARSERFSLGTPVEMKSPKKGLFRSLFSKKSKKLSESAPGKYMSKSASDKKDALLFRNSIMMCGVVTSLDEKYVQGLIMVAKEIGRKSEENDSDVKRGSSSPITPQERFEFTAAEESRQWASETFYGMDQSLSIMRSDSRNARLIGF